MGIGGKKMKSYEANEPYLLLPGMRVCLNPESQNYKQLKTFINEEAGYIINLYLSYNDTLIFQKKQKNFDILVKFDDNKIFRINTKNILPINAPEVDVICYYLENNSIYYTINNEKNNDLELEVILNKKRITNITIYDDIWRQNMLEAYKNLS